MPVRQLSETQEKYTHSKLPVPTCIHSGKSEAMNTTFHSTILVELNQLLDEQEKYDAMVNIKW